MPKIFILFSNDWIPLTLFEIKRVNINGVINFNWLLWICQKIVEYGQFYKRQKIVLRWM